jgi:catechol 2,3-dioxygenase-like lactoylglutathione lyase family enzyme
MIEGVSAVTLGTHEMPRTVRFYRSLGFEVLHGGDESSFTSFRAGTSYLNLIAQSSTLPISTHFTTVHSQRNTNQLPRPATPNG